MRNEVGIEDRDEIKEDEHPIVVVAAADVVDLLRRNGKGSAAIVAAWLEKWRDLSRRRVLRGDSAS